MSAERPNAIAKQLSRNDSGETGGHQAGVLVPRDPQILAFFPLLDPTEYNPRHRLSFADPFGEKWVFSFIHYNNKRFGGTRDEYRLTCMTAFMRSHNLKAGDTLTLSRDGNGGYRVAYARRHEPVEEGNDKLKLGSTWRVVTI